MNDKKHVTATEVARELGLRLDYVYMLLRSGRITASKKDGRWQIPVAAVEERLRSREERNGRPTRTW